MSLDFEQIFVYVEQLGFKRLEVVASYYERRLGTRCRQKSRASECRAKLA